MSRTRAPEFPADLEWLNIDHPLTLQSLRGKIVLLDFWTYCCINCMHVLPKLHDLEEKYEKELVVIGVHSAKFRNEGETGNIRQAILRYEISHPVVNDRQFDVWRQYGVRAWPSMALIDPEGYLVSLQSGEGAPEAFEPLIRQMIEEYREKGTLDSTPRETVLERSKVPETLLSYPSKLDLTRDGKTLFVADTNHNRVLVISLPDGRVQRVIGSGRGGFSDGDFAQAELRHPHGLAIVDDMLYIADTENHSIRRANLKTNRLETVAGTGEQGFPFTEGGAPLETSLSSPWDLELINGKIFIAMAGSHQLWTYDPRENLLDRFAGSGREDIIDGALFWAALAQPSGLASDGKALYFADSEVSAVRKAGIGEDAEVETIVGQGLFEFGDVDGVGDRVRLQHPIGLGWSDGMLYVADTYNNKIKRIDPVEKKSITFAGSGMDGMQDGALLQATFDEPEDVKIAGDGTMYIADTNNHLIRIIDREQQSVSTLAIRFDNDLQESMSPSTPPADELPAVSVRQGKGSIEIELQFPPGLKLNKDGGLRVHLKPFVNRVVQWESETAASGQPVIFIPVTWGVHDGTLEVNLEYFYCETERESLCYFGQAAYRIPITHDDSGTDKLQIIHQVH